MVPSHLPDIMSRGILNEWENKSVKLTSHFLFMSRVGKGYIAYGRRLHKFSTCFSPEHFKTVSNALELMLQFQMIPISVEHVQLYFIPRKQIYIFTFELRVTLNKFDYLIASK